MTIQEKMISDAAGKKLLKIARETLEAFVKGEDFPDFRTSDPELQSKAGAFITLRKDHRLRGCLGRILTQDPLWETVWELVTAAASEDPRFPVVTVPELPEIRIEVSVLSPLRLIQEPSEIVLGTHGIYLRRGRASGSFLPEVALETHWSVEELLAHCAEDKAGIGGEAWREAQMFIFTTQIFREEVPLE